MVFVLELKALPDHCVPIGPKFSQAKPVQLNFSTVTIDFRAPKHLPEDSLAEPEIKPRSYIDLSEYMQFQAYQKKSDFLRNDIFLREWRFRGPLFTGVAAVLSCHISLIRPPKYLQHKNLLIPTEFESCIDEHLKQRHSLMRDEGRNGQDAPFDWQVLKDKGYFAPAIRYRGEPVQKTSIISYRNSNVLLALNSEFFLEFRFGFYQACGGTQKEKDQRISPEPLFALTEKIINSIEVNYSPEIQQQIAAIKQQYPDNQLSETRELLNMMSPEQEAQWLAHVKNLDEMAEIIKEYKAKFGEYKSTS